MASMFLGVNDNVKITSYLHYARRMYHNGRKTNLSSSKFKSEGYINLVHDNREDTKDLIRKQREQIKNLDEISLTDIAKKITRAEYKIKKYTKEYNKLFDDFNNCSDEDKPKIYKKVEKKMRAIERQTQLIENLKEEHSQTLDKRKLPGNEFNELTFNVTSLPIHLMRQKGQKNTKLLQEYSKDLLEFFKANIEEIFPNMHISMLAVHLDQYTPHIHLNGFYDVNHNMKQDLTQNFGKEKQFNKLQMEFHHRLKNSDLVKKYNLDIVPLKHGEHYVPLKEKKLIEIHSEQAAKKDIEKFVKKLEEKHKTFIGMDYDSILEDLEKALIKEHYKRLVEKEMKKATKNNLDKLEQENKNNKFQRQKRAEIIKPFEDRIRKLSLNLERANARAAKSLENNAIRLNEALSKNKNLEKGIEKKIEEHEKVILEPYKQELRKQDKELEKLREVVKKHNLEHELENNNSHHFHR